MTKESLDRGPLEGTEALDLYLTELANSVHLMSQQSALLLQALSERAVLLADMAGQAGNTEPATTQAAEQAGQCGQAPGIASNRDTSALTADFEKITSG